VARHRQHLRFDDALVMAREVAPMDVQLLAAVSGELDGLNVAALCRERRMPRPSRAAASPVCTSPVTNERLRTPPGPDGGASQALNTITPASGLVVVA
jgi:hypothetical protein